MQSITVAIMSYGYGPFVAQAIDSVLGQTVMPDQILFVDDCSGEDDIGVRVAHKYGIRTVARKENMGIVANFDDVLRNHVNTPRLMFLGADNYLRPDAIENLKRFCDADIVSYDLAIVGNMMMKARMRRKYCEWDPELGYYVRKFDPLRGIRASNTIHGSALFNVKLAKAVGGYKPMHKALEGDKTAKRPQEDWSLWKRMIHEGKATRVHVKKPLLYYRRHTFNFSGVY